LDFHNVHSALNQNTNIQTIGEYLRWLDALKLLGAGDQEKILAGFAKGTLSTCVLRTQFGDAQCRCLFLDAEGQPRPRDYYLDFGRRAMLGLLDTNEQADKVRYGVLDSSWQRAFEIGPAPSLGQLMGLSTTDPQYQLTLSLVIGDVFDITWWASAMVDAGIEVCSMIRFLNGRNPVSLTNDPEFQRLRGGLQRKMAAVIGRSKARFHDPWGMITLFLASGSQGAWAKLVTSHLVLEKPLS
jgi:hypothetical protein